MKEKRHNPATDRRVLAELAGRSLAVGSVTQADVNRYAAKLSRQPSDELRAAVLTDWLRFLTQKLRAGNQELRRTLRELREAQQNN